MKLCNIQKVENNFEM